MCNVILMIHESTFLSAVRKFKQLAKCRVFVQPCRHDTKEGKKKEKGRAAYLNSSLRGVEEEEMRRKEVVEEKRRQLVRSLCITVRQEREREQ